MTLLRNRPLSDIMASYSQPARYLVTAAGLLASVAANSYQVDYDATTHAVRGILFEPTSTNRWGFSEDLASGTILNATITANAVAAPDGAVTADSLVETAVNGQHQTSMSIAVVVGTVTAISCFVKANTRDRVMIHFDYGGGVLALTIADLTAKTIAAPTMAGGIVASKARIKEFANGWFRISLSVVSTVIGTLVTGIRLYNNTLSTSSYLGDGSAMYIWGLQNEALAYASSYIKTPTASSVARAASAAYATPASLGFNPVESTFVFSFLGQVANPVSSSPGILVARTNDSAEIMDAFFDNKDGYLIMRSKAGGVIEQTTSPINTVADLTPKRGGFSFKADQFITSIAGGAPVTDNSRAMPAGIQRIDIGRQRDSDAQIWLRDLSYMPRAVSGAELQALTALAA